MWFKNIYLLRLAEDFEADPSVIESALLNKPKSALGDEQFENAGFVSPFGGDSSAMCHAVSGYSLFTLAHEKKDIPVSVVREELDKMVKAVETKEGRKVGSREKKDFRDEVEFDLLPRAFSKTTKTDGYFTPDGWLIINTSSATVAERVTKSLRECFTAHQMNLPVAPAIVDQSPTSTMTEWVKSGFPPAPFTLGESVELTSQDDGKSTAKFARHELIAEAVQANIAAGKLVSKLALVWDEKISFTLSDELVISKVKFLDVLQDSMKNESPESAAEKLDIEFALMTGEVSAMLKDLMAGFGGVA